MSNKSYAGIPDWHDPKDYEVKDPYDRNSALEAENAQWRQKYEFIAKHWATAYENARELSDELAELRDSFGPLVKPSKDACFVFKKTLENNPSADMRAIPNEWLLNERSICAEAVYNVESRLSALQADYDRVNKSRMEAESEVYCLRKDIKDLREAAAEFFNARDMNDGSFERAEREKLALYALRALLNKSTKGESE
jgi:predicted nuclease with TOPRIM domain